MYYRTKNLYLAEIGIISYDDEEGEYVIGNDDVLNGYTFVYYRKGEIAKDAFSGTKYCVFEQTDSVYRYKGFNGIINLYSVTTFMNTPSEYVSLKELVNILNKEDPYRSQNVNDIVLLMVSTLNNKASNILDESQLSEFSDKLIELSNKYVEEISNKDGSHNIDSDNRSIKQKYISELLKLDFELNKKQKEKKSDINSELENIKLSLSKS